MALVKMYSAMAVPKGHAGGSHKSMKFIDDTKASGLVNHIIDTVGMQGAGVAHIEAYPKMKGRDVGL
jgi:hypothetical protein